MIVKVNEENYLTLIEYTIKLYDSHLNFNEAKNEIDELIKSGKNFFFLYEDDGYHGMLHLSIRSDYVPGTKSGRVAYVEGIYVDIDSRGKNIGRKFLEYAEIFAIENGINEIASDCLIDNKNSEAFHKACGFLDVERVTFFTKKIK